MFGISIKYYNCNGRYKKLFFPFFFRLYSDAGAIPLVLGSAISAASKFLDRGAVREGSRSTRHGRLTGSEAASDPIHTGRQADKRTCPARQGHQIRSDQINDVTTLAEREGGVHVVRVSMKVRGNVRTVCIQQYIKSPLSHPDHEK